jgi:hypothetical protein
MTTLTSPHDLIAAVPFLIGYQPQSSLVLVSLKNEEVGMALRVDYPTEVGTDVARACDLLVAHLSRENSDAALVIAYVPDNRLDGEVVLAEFSSALNRAQIALQESILIFQGRWRSTLCFDSECCPINGSDLPDIASSRIAAEQVAHGRPMPFANSDDMVDSISSLPLSSDKEFITEVESNLILENSEDIQRKQREGAVGVIDLVSRFISGTMGQDFHQDQMISAKVIGRISEIQVRDFALGSHNEVTLDIYWAVWRYLTRIAPVGFIAPVASLLAAVSYEKGDGALAQKALDRALEDDPAYSLALLLRRVFSAGWPPESFAQMRKDLHPKVCEGIFGR